MPWYVPMIPDADIVALSGSVSNHWSRKSLADIVISWTKTACWRSGSCANRAGEARERHQRARVVVGGVRAARSRGSA